MEGDEMRGLFGFVLPRIARSCFHHRCKYNLLDLFGRQCYNTLKLEIKLIRWITLKMSKSPRLKSHFMITMVNESFKKELKCWVYYHTNFEMKIVRPLLQKLWERKKVPPPASFGDGPAHRDISPLRLTQSGRVANPLLVSHNSTFGQDLPSPWNIRIKK